MAAPPSLPVAFLEPRVHKATPLPGLTALCAGYENKLWRAEQLASHLIEWLPQFALTHSEIESLGIHNVVSLLARAAQVIYNTRTAAADRTRRGEIGELLLHASLQHTFTTIPAISKLYFKDAANDTVKGFDAVHVLATDEALELWLGEAKFYTDIADAVREAVSSIQEHLKTDYLKSEFALITNKIDPQWPYADRLRRLLNPNTSLDEVFDCMAIPVFLTYESEVMRAFDRVSRDFNAAFKKEVKAHHATFKAAALPEHVRVHLFLLPMHCKNDLVVAFDRRLASCQSIMR